MNLEVKNLNFTYSPATPFEKVALKNINFSVKEGDFVGLIGHSGSGKSTLVQHLNGLIKMQTGEITIGDKHLTAQNPSAKGLCFDVGLVFQYPEQQLFAQTVYEDIAFGPKNMGLSDAEVKMRVNTVAQIVGIPEEMLEKSPFLISGGQKRRAAIAGVIAMEPKILILDEPTAGLDPSGRKETLHSIRTVHRQMGMTVILVSHSMEDVAKYCDKLLVMNKGEIVFQGSKAEVFNHQDELAKIGLCAPDVTVMASMLKKNGINIGTNIFTVEQAKNAIMKKWTEMGRSIPRA